ncbi:MAG: thymidylate synthase [Phycisphaerales bacterium]
MFGTRCGSICWASAPGNSLETAGEAAFPYSRRRSNLRSIIHELLWFLKGETNIRYLKNNNVRIWDEWRTGTASLGRCTGISGGAGPRAGAARRPDHAGGGPDWHTPDEADDRVRVERGADRADVCYRPATHCSSSMSRTGSCRASSTSGA